MTDLLDGWEDGSVELPPPAGMSPERIKEKTMEKIRQTKRPRRRMGVRLLACAALAAVFTVSAMAAYHLWGPGELFDPFFTLESAPLDDGQKELLDQIGATNLPPVTSNGVTLTPLAAVADEHTLYLRLRLEAPEGTVLPDMGEQEDHIAHGVGLVDADTGERLNWGMQKARFLPDDTPGDNSLELVFMLLGGPNGANWVDGTSKTLTITDLHLTVIYAMRSRPYDQYRNCIHNHHHDRHHKCHSTVYKKIGFCQISIRFIESFFFMFFCTKCTDN